MDDNDLKREIYQEGYSDYAGECFDGDDEDLYDMMDEIDSEYSCTDYP